MSASEQKSIWSSCLAQSLLLGMTLIFPLKLLGAEQPVPQTQAVTQTPSIPQTPQSDRFDSMEAPRDYLSGKITSFASYLDRFFGGDRHFQESNQSVVQMDLTRVTGYSGDGKLDFAARLNLRLPVTEGRLHLMLETDPDKNITPEPTPGQAVLNKKVTAPGSYGVAARYEPAVESAWHFSTDAGLKFPVPVQPFVRSRASYSAPMGEWRLKAAESVYWFNSIGAGETTQVDWERFISEPVLFRATTTATWLNDKQNFDLSQDFSTFHTLDDRTALLYQVSVVGVSNPQFQVMDEVVLLLYRYRLHREWMFFELSPQLHFPKVNNFRISPMLSMRLEMLLDDSR